MSPKAFLSYSWSSDAHREFVRNVADRLLGDGVNVVLDQYDLKEGHDKNFFMESMVVDPSVTHVLVFCNRSYAEKADARKAGVGTESQIISQEVYKKVDQSKFIPIFCEVDSHGEFYSPTFLKSRIGFDFSSAELVNQNWEKVLRVLFGKPAFQKPAIGKPPTSLFDENPNPATAAGSRFVLFKQAFLQGKSSAYAYRDDFLSSCFDYVDSLRVRQSPKTEDFARDALANCAKLVQIRDLITNWVLLEGRAVANAEFEEALHRALETFLEMRAHPAEVNSWNEDWSAVHDFFAFETFLYVVAALLKKNDFNTLHTILTTRYFATGNGTLNAQQSFSNFGVFLTSSEILNSALTSDERRFFSPSAELVRRQASRSDLPFDAIREADLVALLASFVDGETTWFPQTLYYASYGRTFPLFVRATQQKEFRKLSIITGVESADELRTKTRAGIDRMRALGWSNFYALSVSFWDAMNMENFDTLK